MKYVKAFGLVIAAAMALAFAGVGTASATVLCKATETPCSELNLVAKGKEIHADLAQGVSVIFQTTEGLILETCTGTTFTSVVEKPGGASETAFIGFPSTGLTWSGCTKGVKTVSSGEFEIHHIEGTDNGTLTNNKTFLFGPWFEISIYNGECLYYLPSETHIGVVTGGAGGGSPPKIDIFTRLTKKEGGASCFNDVMWKVTYSITEPAPLYVRPS